MLILYRMLYVNYLSFIIDVCYIVMYVGIW